MNVYTSSSFSKRNYDTCCHDGKWGLKRNNSKLEIQNKWIKIKGEPPLNNTFDSYCENKTKRPQISHQTIDSERKINEKILYFFELCPKRDNTGKLLCSVLYHVEAKDQRRSFLAFSTRCQTQSEKHVMKNTCKLQQKSKRNVIIFAAKRTCS